MAREGKCNLKKKLRQGVACLLICTALCGLMATLASGVPGSASDPVVRLSYLEKVFTPKMIAVAETKALAAMESSSGGQQAKFTANKVRFYKITAEKAASSALVNAVNLKIGNTLAGAKGFFVSLTPVKGQRLTVVQGGSIVLRSGAGVILTEAVSLTTGANIAIGSAVAANNEILFTGATGGIVEFSQPAALLVNGAYTLKAAYTQQFNDLAVALNTMGLLLGDGKDFKLERDTTRIEGLVMMIRMIGDDAGALAHTGTHPFTDIPVWADRYVAYAYAQGWVNGVGANRYAPDNVMDATQFMTLLLRSMEYETTAFAWDKSLDYALSKGVITAKEKTMVQDICKRDHLVYLSYYALDGVCAGGHTLQQKLIDKGAVSQEKVVAARNAVTRIR